MSFWHILHLALRSLTPSSHGKHPRQGCVPANHRLVLEPLEDRRMLSITLHVDADASPGGDGLAWETAYNDLEMALSDAEVRNGDADGTNNVDSIWLAEGTYTPSSLLDIGDARSASFSLLDGVSLYGGFEGTETTLEDRGWSHHITTLCGDLGTLDDNSDNAYTVVYCHVGVEATLDGLWITEGMADVSAFESVPGNSGAGIYSAGNLTVNNTTVSGNSTAGFSANGGAIYNVGVLRVTGSAIVNNMAGWAGGGVFGAGTTAITDSTLCGNAATTGGGISNSGTATVTNSTFAHNSSGLGGGVENSGTLTVTNSTLADNSAGFGGGVYCGGPTATELLNNTLVARNEASEGTDIFQSADTLSGSHNLIGNGEGQSALVDGVNGNLVGTAGSPIDPRLSEWVTFDGGWWGYYFLHGSPAIDAGDNGLALDAEGQPLVVDIHGNPRIHNATVDIGAVETVLVDRSAQTYTVTSLENRIAADGVLTFLEAFCAAGSNQPLGDAVGGSGTEQDVIQFADGLSGTVVVDTLDLAIGDDLSIVGPGADVVAFNATGANRVFYIRPNTCVELLGATISGGAAVEGGGIYNDGGTLTIVDATISENLADSAGGGVFNAGLLTLTNSAVSDNAGESGGGIFNEGSLTIVNSILAGNAADENGGGISNNGGATLATNSTFVGNTASSLTGISPGRGGGIYNRGTLDVTNSAFSDNHSFSGTSDPNGESRGGAVWSDDSLAMVNSTLVDNSAGAAGGGINTTGTATVDNTIVAQNDAGSAPDLSGALVGSYNLIGNGSDQSAFVDDINGNQVGTAASPIDPLVGPWSQFDNGLWGYPLLAGSPAIDAGRNSLLPQDAFDLDDDDDISEPLPIDLADNPRVGLGTVDIGAWELFASQFIVANHHPRDNFLPFGTDVMKFVFSRELTTLAAEDIAITGPNGNVPVSDVSRTSHGDGWSEYTVHFDAITIAGEYQLAIRPTVQDEFGNFLDQDRDSAPGEAVDDRYEISWKTVGPMVESHTPSGLLPFLTPLTHFDITFNRKMDQDSFSLEDVQYLTGPQGPVAPAGYEWLNESIVRVSFEAVAATGTVSVTIGPDIRDQWGNLLDQNQNAVTGESLDAWTGSVTRSISGTLDHDTVFSSNVGEIVVDGTLTIAAGATLTIEPGVTLKFRSGQGVRVSGQLIALGTAEQPVIFTSTGSGEWNGIRVTSTGSIDLDHSEIRHAATAVDANSSGARAVLKNTTLGNGSFGIYVYSPYAEVTAENCLIADNTQTGIFVRADSRHSFKNCTIVGNGLGFHLGGSILTLENCIVAFNGTGLSHHGDPPTATVRNSLFYNPAGQDIVWNGDPGMPDLAANGNMTADPMFVDHLGGGYELANGSPAIDAGTGIQAPVTDILGRSRYDDQGMPNVGLGYPCFVDIGAFERQVDSPLADLAVTHVSNPVPEVVTVGETFELQWTVCNVGAVETTGAWQDLVYLSSDPYLGGNDRLLATFDHGAALASGAEYTKTRALTVPSISGPKYILVHTQLIGSTAHEAVETNNLGVSERVLAVDVPLLELGTPRTATASVGQWDYYRFEAVAGHTVLFTLDGEAGTSSLCLRRRLPPTWNQHDQFASLPQPDQELRLLEPLDGTYHVGVCANSVSGGFGDYTLSANLTTLDIRQVSPSEVGNKGMATIRILGDNFHPDAAVQLIAPDSTIIEGEEYYQDSTTLFATFDLGAASATPGVYDVVVTNPGPESATLADAVTVLNQSRQRFTASLSMPAVARPGRVIECRLEYTNDGETDILSPILRLDSGVDDTAWKLPSCTEWVDGPDFHFMGLSSEGMPTILRPGQTESFVVQMRLPFAGNQVKVTLSSVGAVPNDGSRKLIDWQEFEDDVRPLDMDDSTWVALLAEFQAEIGDTWGGYAAMLREKVEYWHEQGQTISCVRELFGMPDPDPESHPQDVAHTRIRTSYTPEDKFGPDGYDVSGTPEGDEIRYIPDETLTYRVEFWNKPDAEVPTQDAVIIDRLDPAMFDINTLAIKRVGFLNWNLDISAGQVVDTRIDCMPEMNISVEVKAGLGMEVPGFANNGDLDANTLVFWLHTIDPETGEWPEDPMAGFLPPFNPETGFDIGWVEYTVAPVDGLKSGTELANVAYVEFDFAGDIYDHPAPKVDPDVEPAEPAPWINTIDVGEPSSRVETLPDTIETEVLTIRWSGEDDEGGSGIAGHDIYVSTDDGPFELWLEGTTDTEALFEASPGHGYAFYSVARDNVGHEEDAPAVADATITVNSPPKADAGGPYSVAEGGSVQLDASASSDPDLPGDTLTYAWDFDGDGEYDDATDVSPDFSAAGLDGPQTVMVGILVTDQAGETDTATVEVTISNAPPTADAGGPYTVVEGGTVQLDANDSTDPGGDALTYAWDFDGDGEYDDATGIAPDFSALGGDGPMTVTVGLRVTDDDGDSDTATVEVTISNAAPSADAGGPYTVVEGGTVQLDAGGSTDPGGDSLTYTWDFDGDEEYDDATGTTADFSAAGLDGPTTVTVGLLVTDKDGATDAATVEITIANVAPTADAGGPYAMVQGGSVVLDGAGSSDPGDDISTYEWDLDGDGTYESSGVTATFESDVAGHYSVGLRVTDADGAVDETTVGVTVEAAEPADLGVVDFTRLAGLDVSGGDLWYQYTAARAGRLTTDVSVASGAVDVAFYTDLQSEPLMSGEIETDWRFDDTVEVGETFYLRIGGDSTEVTLTVANLVVVGETEVHVCGTEEDDDFRWYRTTSDAVSINGVGYSFEKSMFESFVFDGGAGDDTAFLQGGDETEIATFFPDHGTFGENGYLVTVNAVTSITAQGGGGGDSAFLYDSPGDDTFVSRPGYGKLSGDRFALETIGFLTNYGYAINREGDNGDGGSDVAIMEDATYADKFKFDWPKPGQFFGKMYGGGSYYNRAKNFEQIEAMMSEGKDRVRLFDSEGGDTFYGQKDESRLVGDGFDVTVSGYDTLAAYASVGNDIAHLEDSDDDDTTRARPHKITLWGGEDAKPTYEIMARRFDEYRFEGKHGGFDRAKLHDTAISDHVDARENSTSLYKNDGELDLLYEVVAFEWVKLYATDNDSDDTLEKEDSLEFQLVYDEGLWEEL